MKSGPRLPHAFGRYILRARVAAGGMAEVFRATLPGFGGFEKEVAIKRMYRQYSEDAAFVEMLTDEAKIVSQLHHPNVVQILDVGRVDEDYYIAFEYVAGVDLFRLLQKQFEAGRDLPIAMAMHIVAELCSALDYAHARRTHDGDLLSIVHRDVSPQNVLVGYQGEVKLTDFGIAKAAYRFTQTQAGMIKGKVYYMSPEQARGEPIDHRSDLFAAGILLYELLCTRPLYGEGNPKELTAQVARGEYSWPADKKARVPSALLAVVDKALQRNAGQRYQSGRELRAALLRVADQLGLRTDREALGAYVRKLFGVDENRPAALSAGRAGADHGVSGDAGHWSTDVGLIPSEPDLPTTRRPSRQPTLRAAGLPRAADPATLTMDVPDIPGAHAEPSAPTSEPLMPGAVSDGTPPPLPTATAPVPTEGPGGASDGDDATAMLDMADLAARLANAPAPAPLHSAARAQAAPPAAPRATGPSHAQGPVTGRRRATAQGVAVPAPPGKRARNPHLLRTGKHAEAAQADPTAQPMSTRAAEAERATMEAAVAVAGAPGASALPRGPGSARPAPSLNEAATRFVQAMPDDDASDAAPRAQAAAASQHIAEASTRFVQAMPDEDASPENQHFGAARGHQGALLDPDDEPASWGLIGITALVWAGVLVLGVYSTLLLVR